MPEPTDLPAAMRAAYDRLLAEAVDSLLLHAADRDGLDVIDANVDLARWLSEHMSHVQLAASAAALAIRLHRTPAWRQVEGERYGVCGKCGRLARWWDDPLAARWVHVQPWAVTGPAAHLAEVADA